jgi:hypothetical protein
LTPGEALLAGWAILAAAVAGVAALIRRRRPP